VTLLRNAFHPTQHSMRAGSRPLTESSSAVFLSYASQDAEAAQRICEALRAAGIQVWFDKSELRGGDAWDTSIRKQIKTCALFLPVISHNTHDRVEGISALSGSSGRSLSPDLARPSLSVAGRDRRHA